MEYDIFITFVRLTPSFQADSPSMKRTLAYLASTILLISSCNEKDTPADNQQKDEEMICFNTGHMATRAVLIDGDGCLYDSNKGGGSFSVDGYIDGTASRYIAEEWVYFFEDNGTW